MAPPNHHHTPEREVLLSSIYKTLMIRQTKSISQSHAAHEVTELGFKPWPRGGNGEWGLTPYSAILPEL